MNILLSLLVIGLVGWMIIKKYKPQSVLIAAGLLLMLMAYFLGYADNFVPEKQRTGFIFFDMFEYLRRTTSKDLAGLGLTIMAVTGFAKYMDHIGASSSLVRLAMKPLSKVNAPYVIMAFSFLLCMTMALVITSASGLAMLTMVTIFPILTRLGISRLGAASIVSTGHLIDVGPSTATTILVSQTANVPIMDYFINSQMPVYIVTGVCCAITHYFWQKYLDKKAMAAGTFVTGEVEMASDLEAKEGIAPPGPMIYALLPIVPLVLLLTCSDFGIKTVQLHVVTAMFISFTLALLFELIRSRDLKKTFSGIQSFLKGMGDQFVMTVSLIIAGETFAYGLKMIGSVDALVNGSQALGINMYLITLGFVAVIIFFCVVMGSGVATMFAFAPIVPNVAKGLGAPMVPMLLVLQNAASVGRLLSPISAVNIAVCGISGVAPFELIKRNSVPILVSLAVSTTMIFIRNF